MKMQIKGISSITQFPVLTQLWTINKMPFTTNMFQVVFNSTRVFSTTPGYSRTVFGSSGGAQDTFRDQQCIDRETVDIMHTANWGNTGSTKDDIKMLVREQISRAKQEHRGKIANSWK